MSEEPADTPADTPREVAPQAPTDGWKKLHPLSVGVNLIPRTWILLRQVWPLMVGWFVLGRVPGQALVDLGVLLMFLSPAFVGTILHWALLRYRMVGHHLEVETGLLNRQTRLIAVDRVQNVELVRTVFHRLFRLVEVRIETASGKEVEGLLSALSIEDADALLRFLEQGRARVAKANGIGQEEAQEQAAQVVVDASLLDLLWYGATGTRLASVAVLLGFVYEAVVGPGTTPDQIGGVRNLSRELAPVLLVAVVTGAWWLGVGSAIGRFYGYRLTRQGDALVSEQGLFTRRAARLGLGKIQTLSFVEPFLRRRLGFGSIAIETASARQEGDGLERAETVVPYVERADATRVLRAALPHLPDLDGLALLPAHPWAARRAVARALLGSLLTTLLAVALLGPAGVFTLVLAPATAIGAWLDVRSQGYLVDDAMAVSRRGYWTRSTVILPLRKVQSVDLRQGPWLRRRGLAELVVRVAGSRVALPVQELAEAVRTRDQILRAIP